MKLLLKYFLFMILVGMLLGLINRIGKQPEPFAQETESYQRLQDGDYKVEFLQQIFVDASRATQANNDYAGDTKRELKTNIWLPVGDSDEPHPLIIYSHGFSSNNDAARVTNAHLASHGYVVMAPNFPLTNTFAPGEPLAVDVANQPGDVSFVIDQAIELSKAADGPLSGKIDAARIAAIGISMGGLTSTVAALHPLDNDSRIRAAISIAGPLSFFSEMFFENSTLPFMMIGGELDVIVPFDSNAAPALTLIPNATLVTVQGGSHLGFADIAEPLRWLKNPDLVGCYFVEKNLADEAPDDPRWQGLFGPEELGISYTAPDDLCIHESLPTSINVLRQTALTRLAVRAFLDSHLLVNPDERRAASNYLYQVFADEAAEILVERNRLE